jgi:S-adenosylmethionine decarboxylase proenzyme
MHAARWPDGTHLTADLSGCRPAHPWMSDHAALRQACMSAVAAAGLTAVGERFHSFPPPLAGGPGGVTGVLLLAESHLAVHTWPEHGVVTLDVFVCNLRGDNQARARHLLDALIAGFEPQHRSVQAIRRCMPTADKT